MKQTLSLTRKELDSYFSSPMALIFVGVFLATTLFTFFWVDGFFARGVADVRSLFRWLPILMIFLVAALTMRQWSEEEQTGTLEILMTLPARLAQLVIGKFLAVLLLVIVALALTLFLPVSVALVGNLDWGPVFGGYLAAILMAAGYIAIGLFVSSRTNNQIVALTLAVIVCGLFHLVGSPTITELVDPNVGEILRAIGTGSRFESIERGVIDLRDLVYYLSLTGAFLAFNVLSLDNKRWSTGQKTEAYRRNSTATAALIALNLVLFNGLLFPLNTARLDLTQYGEYSLSAATRDLLQNLQEPLLIRGYFSQENHPLLAPLIPRLEDLLEEYQVAAGGNLQLEFIDPITNPDLEAEANQTYGIRPTPLQVSDRSGVSVINVYFDILIRYGDQSAVLNFADLIEVEQFGDDFAVRLRNPEYDLTRTIQRAVLGFQSVDAVLESLDQPAVLTLYVTPDTLPTGLEDAPAVIESVARDIEAGSDGQFVYRVVNVDDPASGVDRDSLFNRYQIQPIATSFFSSEAYYLHLVLEAGDRAQVIYPSGVYSEAETRNVIEAALKRSATGFLQVVGLWTPPYLPTQDSFGQQISPVQQYTVVAEALRENYEVRQVDLTSGQVPEDIDVLMIIAPQSLTDLERYAIDQYLMRGGSLFIAASNYRLAADPTTGNLALLPVDGGLKEMLDSYGISVGDELVLDAQNEPFPVQTQRNIGGLAVSEIQAINYPHFVDVRPDGMARDSSIVASVPALTLNWVSPITIDEEKNAGRTVIPLLKSTANSWVTTSTTIQPDLQLYPQWGFPVEGEMGSRVLAVAVQGRFDSYYQDHPVPFDAGSTGEEASDTAQGAETDSGSAEGEEALTTLATVGTLESSPASAQLVVVGSAEFLNDNIFRLSRSYSGDRYLNNLQFVQNSVDWFVQDASLASIRSRGTTARLLKPLTAGEERFWETANYVLALLALLALGVIWRLRKRSEKPMPLLPPAGAATDELATHS